MKNIKSVVIILAEILLIGFAITLSIMGLIDVFSSIKSVIIIILTFLFINVYMTGQRKKQSRELTLFVINKRREETEKEINRIETKFDLIEQQIEETKKANSTLLDSLMDFDLNIERLKTENTTPETETEIEKISSLRKSLSDEMERNHNKEERLNTELKILSASLGGYKSALHSIKEITNALEGVIYD